MKHITKILILAITSTIAITANAETVSVNVFANIDSNINTTIKQINSSFSDSGIYTNYHIKPFMQDHKVHLTMYLTEYDSNQLPMIESIVADIAKSSKNVTFQDTGVSLKASNFLMLDVANNIDLQRLSDKIAAELMNYRDKNSQIPSWAKTDPLKSTMFNHYGSPNVFDGFDPHFSIFVANISPNNQTKFESEVNLQIGKLNFKPQSYQIKSIGVGITDKNGQITKILNVYNLQNQTK